MKTMLIDFVEKYVAMRNKQKEFFDQRKLEGGRYKTKVSNALLKESKQLETELDNLAEFLLISQPNAEKVELIPVIDADIKVGDKVRCTLLGDGYVHSIHELNSLEDSFRFGVKFENSVVYYTPDGKILSWYPVSLFKIKEVQDEK